MVSRVAKHQDINRIVGQHVLKGYEVVRTKGEAKTIKSKQNQWKYWIKAQISDITHNMQSKASQMVRKGCSRFDKLAGRCDGRSESAEYCKMLQTSISVIRVVRTVRKCENLEPSRKPGSSSPLYFNCDRPWSLRCENEADRRSV